MVVADVVTLSLSPMFSAGARKRIKINHGMRVMVGEEAAVGYIYNDIRQPIGRSSALTNGTPLPSLFCCFARVKPRERESEKEVLRNMDLPSECLLGSLSQLNTCFLVRQLNKERWKMEKAVKSQSEQSVARKKGP